MEIKKVEYVKGVNELLVTYVDNSFEFIAKELVDMELTMNGIPYYDETTQDENIRGYVQKQRYSSAIQQFLDKKARSLRYDDMKSVRSYAGYVNTFQAEATHIASWCSSVWAYVGQVEAQVLAQTRTLPTIEELINELPAYV